MITLSVSLDCCRRIFVWRSGAGRQSAGRSARPKKATNHPDHTTTPCLQSLVRSKPEALSKSEGGSGQGDRSQRTDRPGKLMVAYFMTFEACTAVRVRIVVFWVVVQGTPKMRQQVTPNRRYPPTRLHSVPDQNTRIWMLRAWRSRKQWN
jgi:hypothetical protein